MNYLSKKQQFFLFLFFTLVILFTRGNHFPTITQLPDATWAIFFLIGFYFASPVFLIAAIVQFVLIDYFVVTKLGIGEYCYTAAYIFLPFAYSCLWIAGRWLSKHWESNLRGALKFFIAAFLGILTCEIISSGSFNLINQTQANGFDLIELLIKYLPSALKTTFGYLLIAGAIHSIIIGLTIKKNLPKKP